MTRIIQQGDFVKQVGGDAGIYFDGKTWKKFECLGCGYALGMLKNRLPNGDYIRTWDAFFGKTAADKGGYSINHDVQVHKIWLGMGKPVHR